MFRAESTTPATPPPPIFDAYVCSNPEPNIQEWQLPQPGELFAYLVTALNVYYESSLGASSDGTPRVEGTPCP